DSRPGEIGERNPLVEGASVVPGVVGFVQVQIDAVDVTLANDDGAAVHRRNRERSAGPAGESSLPVFALALAAPRQDVADGEPPERRVVRLDPDRWDGLGDLGLQPGTDGEGEFAGRGFFRKVFSVL